MVIAVGVGKEVNKPELTSIAMGDVNHVFMVDQYTDLVKIINALLDKSCSGKFFRLKRKEPIHLLRILRSYKVKTTTQCMFNSSPN